MDVGAKWYEFTVEYYSVIKVSLCCTTAWTNIENIKLNRLKTHQNDPKLLGEDFLNTTLSHDCFGQCNRITRNKRKQTSWLYNSRKLVQSKEPTI